MAFLSLKAIFYRQPLDRFDRNREKLTACKICKYVSPMSLTSILINFTSAGISFLYLLAVYYLVASSSHYNPLIDAYKYSKTYFFLKNY